MNVMEKVDWSNLKGQCGAIAKDFIQNGSFLSPQQPLLLFATHIHYQRSGRGNAFSARVDAQIGLDGD